LSLRAGAAGICALTDIGLRRIGASEEAHGRRTAPRWLGSVWHRTDGSLLRGEHAAVEHPVNIFVFELAGICHDAPGASA